MSAKVKRDKNVITLPDSIVRELGDVEYFDVVAEADQIVLTPTRDQPKKKNRAAEIRGVLKGKVWMSDDFDGPMEEFAEYM